MMRTRANRVRLFLAFALSLLGVVAYSTVRLDAEELETAESIDSWVESAARRDSVELPPMVGDDQFLRRISLDLLGRIPSQKELLAFRDSPDRPKAVERMLDSDEFARFWSRHWTNTLIGFGQSPQVDREALRSWLESRFANDQSFDQTAFTLISAEGRAAFEGPANFMLRHARDPVVPVARIFLGVQLDCARCHDHPFDRWTQDDFEGMARFFSLTQPRQPSPGTYEIIDRRPNGGATPVYLTGTTPRTGRWRQELALMVTGSKPFARATANRLWYHFFGHGIVDPIDAVNSSESNDKPLLRYLAGRLRNSDYQLKSVIKEICTSNAYQRDIPNSSWRLAPGLKPMTPDQMYDSLRQVLGASIVTNTRTEFQRAAANASLDLPYHNAWERVEQVQTMMARMDMRLPDLEVSPHDIYEQVLSRPPTPSQLLIAQDERSEDLLFALLNSNEFFFWH